MQLIDVYGGDDHRSMAANNTSAFNCRFVSGTRRWSMHAYGRAVDLNPVQNPWVSGSEVQIDRISTDSSLTVQGIHVNATEVGAGFVKRLRLFLGI